MTFLDSNILLDVTSRDPVWARWSLDQLGAATLRGALLVNDVVYAELSTGFPGVEALDEFLDTTGISVARIPARALFLAGRAFRTYRAAGSTRTGVLPDFFIGAHAAVLRIPLLTRDTRRYRSYFPTLALITPAPFQ
ncbi:MAG: type II toxin-antitoxin system VapC family toxin [Proteobacteria bacterium]|nr:type II toxin-antitoxin system VapC family toxin [Pseudomonadota bacterium]